MGFNWSTFVYVNNARDKGWSLSNDRTKTNYDRVKFLQPIINILNFAAGLDDVSLFYENIHIWSQIHIIHV